MSEPDLPEDEEEEPVAKEMFDATYRRVDVIKGPASGMRFVVLKAGEEQGPDSINAIKEKSAVTKKQAAPEAGTEQEAVVKADGDLDPTEVLAEPEGDAPGDPNVPGTPAWEAVDAATAMKWTAILGRAKYALGMLADREAMEVASGDGEDAESAWDLEDAACAIDYAISLLAPFAVGEQAESEQGAEELDGVRKACSEIRPGDLDLLEGMLPVRKAGRVLSASNEQAIRNAVESLQGVLSSLPQAPEVPVVKSQEPEAPPPADPPAPVVKASKEPMVAVYTADGKLLGAVDEEKITPLATGTPAEGAPEPT